MELLCLEFLIWLMEEKFTNHLSNNCMWKSSIIKKKKVKTGNPHLAIDSSAATETAASYATTLAAFYSTGFFHMYFLVWHWITEGWLN